MTTLPAALTVLLIDSRSDRAAHLPDIAQLSESSQTRLAQIHAPVRRKQFILGRVLLAQAAARQLGRDYPLVDIVEGALYPVFATAPELQGSISHSGDLVAATVNADRYGLDIENCTRKRDAIALSAHAFHADEAQWIAQADAIEAKRRFFLLWTLREAAFKAGLREHVVGGDSLLTNEDISPAWGWASAMHGSYRITVVGPQPCELALLDIGVPP
ncbi:4'-phosphopantetheinyl transferase family protein [Andreprevotia chitinilytica]|uniref:4'-phosphopantetheinyl transferase family protein n=1 Tax=Andreprevotia chitinilytica TaxID=396808 RepID=UPI00054D24B9|nr:4'-phosphopantetheinyl transferase superfamily protein [Andreprevotia chitinilytica]